MRLRDYEKNALKEIAVWEKEKHSGFHKKILDVTAKPVDFIIEKVGPELERFNRSEKALEESVQLVAVAFVARFHPPGLTDRLGCSVRQSNHESMEPTGNIAFIVYRKRFLLRKRFFRADPCP